MRKIFLLAIFTLAGLVAINAQAREQLFSVKEMRPAKAAKTSVASVREAEIEINFAGMMRGSSTRLSIPLFDNKTYEAAQVSSEGFEARAMNDFTWRGKIVSGKFEGDVILTAKKGFMSGLIYSPEAVYEITPRGDKNILMQLDQNLFPPCAGDIRGEEGNKTARPEGVPAGVDSGDRIDVIVVYTTATKNAAGGDTQAQTIAQQAVDASNTAYRNSKIRQRLRLVHSQEHLYTEIDPNTDLSNLRNNTTIQNLRNSKQADLVDMMEETTAVCGIGYLMGTVSPGSQNNGFTVTARTCAVGNLSFAHELGHNMGSAHNPENGSGASFPYGFGHWVNGSYRTVMSYVDPCTSGCTRVAYFSNPAIIFNGVPTGIDNARDNARSIENTADSIANYRYSGISLTLNNLNAGETVPRNISRTVNWFTSNLSGGSVKIELSRDESTNWETLIATTPNDGSEVINITGRPTRRARIRITSIENPTISDSSAKNFIIR
jgi:hypothetical protein